MLYRMGITQDHWSTYWKAGIVACVALALGGCMMEQPGLSENASSKYAKVAVLPAATDDILSVYWPSALADPEETSGRMGGNTASLVGRSAAALLSRAGAATTFTNATNSATARKNEVVVVLRQAPIDRMGLVYDPGRDFLVSGAGLYGLLVVAAGESQKSTRFKPRTVVQIRNPRKSSNWMGENQCFFALKPALADPQTGELVEEADIVVAHETIPVPLTARHWGALNRSEQSAVRTACSTAVQKAVSMALARLSITRRR